MFETPMPEIPKKLWDESTVDMYWEVRYVNYPHDNYRVSLMRKVEFVEPSRSIIREIPNPKKRWWNFQPEYVEETEEVSEKLVKGDQEVESSFLSSCLDFTAEDVYNGALDILGGLSMRQESKKLLGTYPPKSLDIDPYEL